MTSNKLLLVALILIAAPFAGAAEDQDRCATATGSYGGFTPMAFTGADEPWQVIRTQGLYTKSGYPCDNRGQSCSYTKEYSMFTVSAMQTDRCIDIGVNDLPLLDVKRVGAGTYKQVEIMGPGLPMPLARMDGTRGSSRFGVTGAETKTISRTKGLHGGIYVAGYVESKSAAWAITNPHSFYYNTGDDQNPAFGLTVAEEMMVGGVVGNFLAGTPGRERMRGGTYWCASDEWQMVNDGFESMLKSEEFNMDMCHGTKLMEAVSDKDFSNVTAGFFLNRMDSTITMHNLGGYTYKTVTDNDWPCLINCDGTSYQIDLPTQERMVHFNSQKWNWLSSSGFKVKIARMDWERDGLISLESTTDLREIANDPEVYKDILAVVVTENKDTQGGSYNQGEWSGFTYIMFPPNPAVPSAFRTKYRNFTDNDRLIDMAYQAKVFDAVLAMMPNSAQTSPELADVEEKLDELRLWINKTLLEERVGFRSISQDMLFDIFSEVDATTAVSWVRPNQKPEDVAARKVKQGKIEWLLKEIGEL